MDRAARCAATSESERLSKGRLQSSAAPSQPVVGDADRQREQRRSIAEPHGPEHFVASRQRRRCRRPRACRARSLRFSTTTIPCRPSRTGSTASPRTNRSTRDRPERVNAVRKEVESRRGVVTEAIAGLDAQGRADALRSMSAGSIDSLGSRFVPFRIIRLELVDQNIGSWNQVAGWLKQLDGLRVAA
jgi:hypothetical protein